MGGGAAGGLSNNSRHLGFCQELEIRLKPCWLDQLLPMKPYLVTIATDHH